MVKLETVEDFEKIANILKDDGSYQHQYQVKSFGYCSVCQDITQYSGHYNLEDCAETCLKCNTVFGKLGGQSVNTRFFYTTYITNIPSLFHVKVSELRSREQQKTFFYEALESFLKKQKAKKRKIETSIRRLAKLRS